MQTLGMLAAAPVLLVACVMIACISCCCTWVDLEDRPIQEVLRDHHKFRSLKNQRDMPWFGALDKPDRWWLQSNRGAHNAQGRPAPPIAVASPTGPLHYERLVEGPSIREGEGANGWEDDRATVATLFSAESPLVAMLLHEAPTPQPVVQPIPWRKRGPPVQWPPLPPPADQPPVEVAAAAATSGSVEALQEEELVVPSEFDRQYREWASRHWPESASGSQMRPPATNTAAAVAAATIAAAAAELVPPTERRLVVDARDAHPDIIGRLEEVFMPASMKHIAADVAEEDMIRGEAQARMAREAPRS